MNIVSVRCRVILTSLAFLPLSSFAAAPADTLLPYKRPDLPVDQRVRDLLSRMTVEEKFWQLFMIPGDLSDGKARYAHGIFGLSMRGQAGEEQMTDQMMACADSGLARANAIKTNAAQRFFVEETRLGIPIIPFEECLHGLVRPGATSFPQSIALAATWDTALVGRVATAIAREAKSRGVRDALSPVINLATDQRWGRVEETYGEDPYLSAEIGAAFVAGFQNLGVIATPKHMIANVGDGGRDSYPIDLDERYLEEIHFPPYRAVISRGGAMSVMTSYNSLNGIPCSDNAWLLRTVLKERWKFDGFVISDASAVGGTLDLHHVVQTREESAKRAIEAGLDVIFQTDYDHHLPLLKAFTDGTVDQRAIDSAVARVLRAKFRLGLFEHPYVNPDEADRWNGAPEHRALAREAAVRSIVLLKNDRDVLPLKSSLRTIAVIGEDAGEARLGGYSGPGIRKVSILDGIRNAAGSGTKVVYAGGCKRLEPRVVPVPESCLTTSQGAPGVLGEYFATTDLSGPPALVRRDPKIDFGWTLYGPGPPLRSDCYSVRWTGRLKAPRSGVYSIGVDGDDGFRIFIDGRPLIDRWRKQTNRTSVVPFRFEGGRLYDIKVEFHEGVGNVKFRFVWDVDAPHSSEGIAQAIRIAGKSDVAVLVAGLEEGEFRDRASLDLPGRQEELIRKVASTGKPVVVILVGGGAVTIRSWLDLVDGIVDVWYPGEEGGNAVADVLFGRRSAGGKLPITFPWSVAQSPLVYNHKPTGRGDDYLDMTGKAMFPFGFGLSYVTFEYSDLQILPAAIPIDGKAVVTCSVKNTGRMTADEVVQLYIRHEHSSTAQPVLALKGFTRVTLGPGEGKQVSFEIGPEALAVLNPRMEWVVEPGDVRILVGASSRDIRLHGGLAVGEGRQ
jgi:beta-glucosidase